MYSVCEININQRTTTILTLLVLTSYTEYSEPMKTKAFEWPSVVLVLSYTKTLSVTTFCYIFNFLFCYYWLLTIDSSGYMFLLFSSRFKLYGDQAETLFLKNSYSCHLFGPPLQLTWWPKTAALTRQRNIPTGVKVQWLIVKRGHLLEWHNFLLLFTFNKCHILIPIYSYRWF